MKTDEMGELVLVSVLLKDASGMARKVEFWQADKIQGLLEDDTPLGEFIRSCAGAIEHKGIRGAN